ncbi:MAG: hypothetical protein JXJ04_11330 [Spirochaetales bacterium]|nr:hypothetical protein [Spirochaetales bacterium]
MRLLRHLGKLLKEFFGFAMDNKAWWIIPIIVILLIITILIVATSTLAPFIYPLF